MKKESPPKCNTNEPLNSIVKPARKRKSSDKAWTPRAERSTSRRQSGSLGLKTLFNIMGVGGSPAKKTALVSGSVDSAGLPKQTNLIFSTPQKGILTTAVITPQGSKLLRSRTIFESTSNRGTSLFLPEEKVGGKRLILPLVPNAEIESLNIPAVSMAGFSNVPITLESIEGIEQLVSRRRDSGENPRTVSQNKLMGNESANNALIVAGIQTEKGLVTKEDKIGQWLHFKPHSAFGDNSQTPDNVGLGTRHSNGAMELINHVMRKIFRENPDIKVLYLNAVPTWVPGFEKIRLLQGIHYQLKDGPHDQFKRGVACHFDTLSLDLICESEIEIIENIILQSFKKGELDNSIEVTAQPSPNKKLKK